MVSLRPLVPQPKIVSAVSNSLSLTQRPIPSSTIVGTHWSSRAITTPCICPKMKSLICSTWLRNGFEKLIRWNRRTLVRRWSGMRCRRVEPRKCIRTYRRVWVLISTTAISNERDKVPGSILNWTMEGIISAIISVFIKLWGWLFLSVMRISSSTW